MQVKQFAAVISLAFAALGSMAGAQAQTMQAIQGANVVFYYDADVWGTNTATVTGNSISFAMPASYQVSATGLNPTDEPFNFYLGHSTSALVVVAKSGYTLASAVDVGLQGSANLVAGGSTTGYVGQYLSYGNYEHDLFMPVSSLEYIALSGYTEQTGYSEHYTTAAASATYKALGFNGDVLLSVGHTGSGVSTASIDQVSYAFNVSAVPEPDTYLLLLAGVGVLAYARRRHGRA